VDIWQHYTGRTGLTNPGFEKTISGQGFDWRHWGEKDGAWALKRVNDETAEGNYALKITFKGQENIAFHHLYQIFRGDILMRNTASRMNGKAEELRRIRVRL
jgi:hypothetical protein